VLAALPAGAPVLDENGEKVDCCENGIGTILEAGATI